MSMPEIKRKGAVAVGPGTTYRYKEPISGLWRAGTQFRVDYEVQQAHVPHGIVSATQKKSNGKRCTNSSGRAACMGPVTYSHSGSVPPDRGNY